MEKTRKDSSIETNAKNKIVRDGEDSSLGAYRHLLSKRKYSRGRHRAIATLALREGVSSMTIRRRLMRLKKKQPLSGIQRNSKVVQLKHRSSYNEALRIFRFGPSLSQIARMLGVNIKTMCRWHQRMRRSDV